MPNDHHIPEDLPDPDDPPISENVLARAYGGSPSDRFLGLKRALSTRLARTEREAASGNADRYDIRSEIARGGVGIVYRAYDRQLQRAVALKTLNPDFADHPEMVDRFVEEAQVGGQLQHPGIVPVHEVGRDERGCPFFAMKLVEGRTLAEILGDASATRTESVRIFERICQTVAYAHDRGIVHRDLKPANIMVGAFGEVQVMDWGLAKVIGSTDADDVIETVRTSSIAAQSRVGSVMGTPAYMPPEQAQGRIDDVDERSDVFSLGAILCELLTGAPPYVASGHTTVMELAAAADTSEAKRRILGTDADPALRDLALACLAAAPTSRPASGTALADRVSSYLASVEERAQEARVQATRARARNVVLGVTLLAVVAGGIAFAVWESDKRERTRVLMEQIAHARTEAEQKAEEADRASARDASSWSAIEAIAERAAIMARNDLLPVATRDAVADWRGSIATRAKAAREEARRLARDARMTHVLEALRNDQATEGRYERIFGDYGIDLSAPPERNAAVIAASSIPRQLIDGLDAWLLDAPDRALRPSKQRELKTLLDVADRDAFRSRLRETLISNDASALDAIAAELTSEHDNLQSVILAAQYLRRSAEADKALALLRRAYPKHTSDFNLLLELVKAHWIADQPAEALAHVRGLQAARPDTAFVWSIEAETHLLLGDFDRAESAARRALELDPDRIATAHHALYAAALNRREHEKALAHLRRALAIDERRFAWWQQLGLHYLGANRLADAEAAYRNALAWCDRFPEARYELAATLEKTGRIDEALAEYERAIEDGLAEARTPGRARWHRTAYDVNQFIYQARLNVARIHFDRAAYDRAIRLLRDAIAMKRSEPVAVELAAACLTALGAFPEALRTLTQGTVAHPDDAGLHFNLAVLRFQLGYETDAIESARASYARKRESRSVSLLVSILTARSELEDAEAAIERARRDGVAVGSATRELRQRERAESAFDRVQDTRAIDRPAALLLFGDIASRRGDHQEAIDMFGHLLSRSSDDPTRGFDEAFSAAVAASRALRATKSDAGRAEFFEAMNDWVETAIDWVAPKEQTLALPRQAAVQRLGTLRYHHAFAEWFASDGTAFSEAERTASDRIRRRLDRLIADAAKR